MTLKTMAELNANEPHLRDLKITVDGLNVVDIQLPGPGVWAPRFTVQISGDQGINEATGGRYVYLAAAEYLRSVLLNNGTGDGTRAHAFVPHANVSREDLDGDLDNAVSVANRAITRLLEIHNGTDAENDGKPVEQDLISVHGKGLHIVVELIDFDLTEKRILSAESFDKLQAAIDAPANPSPELVALMQGERRFTTAVENGGEPLEGNDELALSNVTKSFDGVLHVSVVLEGSLVAPNQVYWIPADRANEFPSLEAIRRGTVLTCIANGNDWIEYLVQIPDVESAAPEIKPDVRATTTLIDGIPHKRFERQDNGVTNVFWVPETMDVVIDQDSDIPDDLIMQIIAEDDNGNLVWQVIARKSVAPQ